MTKIGVFDSGIGGLSVARAIEKALPKDEIVFVNDTAHVPYGTRRTVEIKGFVVPILQGLVEQGCQVIVVACNTVSTTLIEELRAVIDVPLVAMEPMVKPGATATKTGKIAIFATPNTLASKRYALLKETYTKNIDVLEPDCSSWTAMIETNQVDKQKIASTVEEMCQAGVDVIVLGCTHYHWIEELIKTTANGRAEVLQPEQPVIKQLARILQS